ncbi:hypothetical protein [Absidia glauca]|uniref:Uncharacterized protein n=1 Tax=Absidia glauca TaxID=4829 RepID=A0A168R373_ABSGL|nr:hypothetical protein [Absidia glauca]
MAMESTMNEQWASRHRRHRFRYRRRHCRSRSEVENKKLVMFAIVFLHSHSKRACLFLVSDSAIIGVVNPGNHRPIKIEEDTYSSSMESLKRTIDEVDGSNAPNNIHEDPVPTPRRVISPDEFRRAVRTYGKKVVSKQRLSEDEVIDLNSIIKYFKPKTIGQQLDLMAGKLSSSTISVSSAEGQALYISLHHTINLVNPEVAAVFKRYLDKRSWEKVVAVDPTLGTGMSASSKKLYDDMLAEGTNEDNKLDKKQLRIAITKAKLSALESEDTDNIQHLDIMETVLANCHSDATFLPSAYATDLPTFRKFMNVLDDMVDDTMLDIVDTEETPWITNLTIPLNFGLRRRIIAGKTMEYSSSFWTISEPSKSSGRKEQSYAIRMNKKILSHLSHFKELPIRPEEADHVFPVAMGWSGHLGYMFAVKSLDDVYVARHLSTLILPTYLDDLPSFVNTLDYLYAWRNHHLQLNDILIPLKRKQLNNIRYEELCGTPLAATTTGAQPDNPNHPEHHPRQRRHRHCRHRQ